MPLEIVDTHAHVGFPRFEGDLDGVLERARAVSVAHIVVIGAGGGLDSNRRALALAESRPGLSAAVGVHPHEAAAAEDDHFEVLRGWAQGHAKVVAVGETGLDYHYDYSPRPVQQAVFRRQVRLAVAAGKPLVIHTREAEADTVAILRDEGAAACGGVIHCFAGTAWLAEQALALGFYLSFSAMITYAWAEAIRDVAQAAPAGRIMVETDAPFLPPAPRRGRNEPAFVAETLRALAELRGVPVEELAATTTGNARRLFNLDGVLGPSALW